MFVIMDTTFCTKLAKIYKRMIMQMFYKIRYSMQNLLFYRTIINFLLKKAMYCMRVKGAAKLNQQT